MRTVSFVDRVDFNIDGNVMSKALTIGDVDNDSNNEIAIANTSGDLYVFKHVQEPKPWAKASKLGMIACLEVGDLTNQGLNCLISLSTEGWCHIFYLTPDSALSPNVFTEGDVGFDATEFVVDNPQTESFNLPSGDERIQQLSANHNPFQQLNFNQSQSQALLLILKPAYVQKLSSNAKACVIADIDGDGCNELVVSYTDRVVRSFKWVPEIPTQSSNSATVDQSILSSTNFCFGALVIHEKWKLAGQVGSMSASKNQSGRSTVLVSQPGGSYVELICSGEEHVDSSSSELFNKACYGPSVRYHPLGSQRARNPSVSTEVISNIVSRNRRGSDEDKMSYSAICTLDGTLTLIDGDRIIRSLCVDHQLFAITKLDVTGDGTDEVVACSWDGQTYIVNLFNEVVRFHFKENVAAFCSGTFSIDKDCPSSVLCYATLTGKLVVFFNVYLDTIGVTNMMDTVMLQSYVTRDLKDLGIDAEDKCQLKEFIRKVMYQPIRTI